MIDTGSDFTYVDVSGQGRRYPDSSKTYKFWPCGPDCDRISFNDGCLVASRGVFKEDVCQFGVRYADGAKLRGVLMTDSIFFDGKEVVKPRNTVPFGVTGGGEYEASIGLGRPMHSGGIMGRLGSTFYFCLPADGAVGTLGFGQPTVSVAPISAHLEMDLLNHPSDHFYRRQYYFVPLVGLKVDGVRLPISNSLFSFRADGTGVTMIDTGAFASYLVLPVYEQLLRAFRVAATRQNLVRIQNITKRRSTRYRGPDACYYMANDKLPPAMPRVGLLFAGGATLALTPDNTLYRRKRNVFCLSFFGERQMGTNTIGGIQLIHDRVQINLLGNKVRLEPNSC